jgi:hypothetical protein
MMKREVYLGKSPISMGHLDDLCVCMYTDIYERAYVSKEAGLSEVKADI